MSPNIDPPVLVLEGSTAKTATLYPFSIRLKPKDSIKVDFPTPGGPDSPILNDLILTVSSDARLLKSDSIILPEITWSDDSVDSARKKLDPKSNQMKGNIPRVIVLDRAIRLPLFRSRTIQIGRAHV